MSEAKFLDGLIVKNPHANAPDFVLAKISFKVDEVIKSLKEHENNGWVNLDLKKSKENKLYAQIDDWKPSGDYIPKDQKVTDFPTDNEESPLPF